MIDFAHLFARQGGIIDFKEVLDKVKHFHHLHCHFSGINYSMVGLNQGNEKSHAPIKVNKPDFHELAKEIVKRNLDITIICESPLIEEDALVMKSIFEKLGHKF